MAMLHIFAWWLSFAEQIVMKIETKQVDKMYNSWLKKVLLNLFRFHENFTLMVKAFIFIWEQPHNNATKWQARDIELFV